MKLNATREMFLTFSQKKNSYSNILIPRGRRTFPAGPRLM